MGHHQQVHETEKKKHMEHNYSMFNPLYLCGMLLLAMACMMHPMQDDYLSQCSTIFLVCTDMTTTEPQGTGRKRGHSDPEGADSEPGK